jgi:hypothetical protein
MGNLRTFEKNRNVLISNQLKKVRGFFGGGFLRTRNNPRSKALIILALGFAWMAAVAGNYYFQLWKLLIIGNWPGVTFHGDLRLPFIQEALDRAVSGSVAAGILMSSAAVLGGIIFRFSGLRFERWTEKLIFAISLGIGIYAFSGLALAALGIYTDGLLKIMAVAPSLIWIGHWFLISRQFPHFSLERPKNNIAHNKIWILLTLLAFGFSFIAALAPEREYDALWYHFYYPRLYLEQGRLVDLV